jgi:hypothetical protein
VTTASPVKAGESTTLILRNATRPPSGDVRSRARVRLRIRVLAREELRFVMTYSFFVFSGADPETVKQPRVLLSPGRAQELLARSDELRSRRWRRAMAGSWKRPRSHRQRAVALHYDDVVHAPAFIRATCITRHAPPKNLRN